MEVFFCQREKSSSVSVSRSVAKDPVFRKKAFKAVRIPDSPAPLEPAFERPGQKGVGNWQPVVQAEKVVLFGFDVHVQLLWFGVSIWDDGQSAAPVLSHPNLFAAGYGFSPGGDCS